MTPNGQPPQLYGQPPPRPQTRLEQITQQLEAFQNKLQAIQNQHTATQDPQLKQALGQQYQTILQQAQALQEEAKQLQQPPAQPATQPGYTAQPVTQPIATQPLYAAPQPATQQTQPASGQGRYSATPLAIAPITQPAYLPQATVPVTSQYPPSEQPQTTYEPPAPQQRDLSLEGILRDYVPIFDAYIQRVAKEWRAKVKLTQIKRASVRSAINEDGIVVYDIWMGVTIEALIDGRNQALVNGALLITPSYYGDRNGVYGRYFEGLAFHEASRRILQAKAHRVTMGDENGQLIENYRDDQCWLSDF